MPLLAIVFISVHYYKVAREHSISLPAAVEEGDMPPEEKRRAEERIDLLPNLMIHELMLASVALLVMVLAVATFYHAPLEAHADPNVTPLHTMAPWYFLWLQGMLKLGDPRLMGVLLPTIIFGLLFVIPWLDRNPNRLARRRPFAVIMGVLACVAILVLTYMGLPQYGIETPQAQDILSELVPATHPGPIKELPWDEIETGPDGSEKIYFVSYPASWEDNPAFADEEKYEFISGLAAPRDDEFHHLLREFKADVENATKLIPPFDANYAVYPQTYPLATVSVRNFQPGLKWLDLRITWDELVLDPATGQPTSIIPYQTEDPKTGEPMGSGAVVYGTLTDQPYVKAADGTKVYFEDGMVTWTDESGEERELALADAVENVKKNNQQQSVLAVHHDSNYGH